MFDDGDRLMALVGVALVGFIVFALIVGVLAAMSASSRVPDTPEAAWSVERVNDTHVSIIHGGGDPVDADTLIVTVDAVERDVSWSGRLEKGDAGAVRATADRTVQLYFVGGRAERVRLAGWRV